MFRSNLICDFNYYQLGAFEGFLKYSTKLAGLSITPRSEIS